jgi:hypothetical protein
MAQRIALSIEGAPKKSFATAVDWPGWSRAGRNEELAVSAIAAYAVRYAVVPELAGEPLDDPEHVDLEVVERIPGSGSTEFGVPGGVTEHDRRPVSAEDGDRLARLVVASWQVFDETVQYAPDELRKGPRGGGRDKPAIVSHLMTAEHAYAQAMGLRLPEVDPADRASIDALRAVMLVVLRTPSDGSPLARRNWTTRYAAHRIAWHALDHAWEIEDRTD